MFIWFRRLPSKSILSFLKLLKSLQEIIGEGSYALVVSGNLPPYGQVAVKTLKLNMQQEPEDALKNFKSSFIEVRHELLLQSSLSHPNIMRIYGFCYSPFSVVFEYADEGTLFDYLNDFSKLLSWSLIIKICYELTSAIAYLHSTIIFNPYILIS